MTTTRTDLPVGRRLLLLAGATAILLAACGGGASAPTPVEDDPAADMAGGEAAADAPAGDYADEELVLGAFEALAGHDSYSYEIKVRGMTQSSVVRGIVHNAPEPARIVNYESSAYLTIGDRYWADLGWGELRPADEPFKENLAETDEMSLDKLYEPFTDFADDFVIDGRDEVGGVPTMHLVIDEYIVNQRVEAFGREHAGWTMEIWLAEEDGRLMKALYGGPLAPLGAFGLDDYTLEVKSVDCDCPIVTPTS